MKIVYRGNENQLAKEQDALTIESLNLQAISCDGECWDCDNCGGSATH